MDKSGALYVISTLSRAKKNEYKLGFHGGKFEGLLNRYRTDLGDPIIFFYINHKNAKTIENNLKDKLVDYRFQISGSNREWFSIDLSRLVRKILKEISSYDHQQNPRMLQNQFHNNMPAFNPAQNQFHNKPAFNSNQFHNNMPAFNPAQNQFYNEPASNLARRQYHNNTPAFNSVQNNIPTYNQQIVHQYLKRVKGKEFLCEILSDGIHDYFMVSADGITEVANSPSTAFLRCHNKVFPNKTWTSCNGRVYFGLKN